MLKKAVERGSTTLIDRATGRPLIVKHHALAAHYLQQPKLRKAEHCLLTIRLRGDVFYVDQQLKKLADRTSCRLPMCVLQ